MSKLRWDICAVTPFDYAPRLIGKLNALHKNIDLIRTQMNTFVAMCYQEFEYSLMSASMIASACAYLSLKHANKMSSIESEQCLLELHATLSGFVDQECLRQCVEQIDELIGKELRPDAEADSCESYSTEARGEQQSSTSTSRRVLTTSTNLLDKKNNATQRRAAITLTNIVKSTSALHSSLSYLSYISANKENVYV